MPRPSDFIKPGDMVILPADDRGIRWIKIVPNTYDEFTLARWLNHGVELFDDPVPKCGYIFESDASKWSPEQIDDGDWDPKPLLPGNLPTAPKLKIFSEKVRDGSYEVSAITTLCTQCGLERDGHQRTIDFQGKDVRYAEVWCTKCERRTLHRTAVTERVAVKLPVTPVEVPKQIEAPKLRHWYDGIVSLIKNITGKS